MKTKNKFIDNLWIYFQQTYCIKTRNVLVENYLYLVTYHAVAMYKKLPPEVSYDDLYSDGVLGLIQAVEKFDLDKNIQFSTFASHRVLGMIRDGLRNRDYVPRLVRQKYKKFNEEINSIQQKLGYKPTGGEIRDCLNINRNDFADKQKDHGQIMNKISLDNCYSSNKSDFARESLLSEAIVDIDKEMINRLNYIDFSNLSIFQDLSRQSRLILILYYRDGFTMKEIAKVIGLHETRISQIHSETLALLKRKLHRRQINKVSDYY